jgi:hypothetical protein
MFMFILSTILFPILNDGAVFITHSIITQAPV